MNFNLHFGELHSDNSINDKNNWFENYTPKCYKVKRILISFNCFSEYIKSVWPVSAIPGSTPRKHFYFMLNPFLVTWT